MQKTINIPDNQAQRFIDAYSIPFGWQPTLEDGTQNPVTQSKFALNKLLETIKAQVKTYEVGLIRQAADEQSLAIQEINLT